MSEALYEYLRVKAGQPRKKRRQLCKDCQRELFMVKEKTDKRCSFCQGEFEESLEETKREAEMPD